MEKIEFSFDNENIFTKNQIDLANQYNESTDNPIVVPTTLNGILVEQWIAWNALPTKNRIIADQKSKEIFDKTNSEILESCNDIIWGNISSSSKKISEMETIVVKDDDFDSLLSDRLCEILNSGAGLILEGTDNIRYNIYKNFLWTYKNISSNSKSPDDLIDYMLCEAELKNLQIRESAEKQRLSLPEYERFHVRDEPYKSENDSEFSDYSFETIWSHLYEAYLMGFRTDAFEESWNLRTKQLQDMRRDLANNEAILENGDCDTESLNEKTDLLHKKSIMLSEDVYKESEGYYSDNYFQTHKGVNIVDISTMSCNYTTKLESSATPNPFDIHPLFLVQLYGGKWYSKIIKGFTKGKFSHAGIALDANLSKIYSYTQKGYTIESLTSYKESCENDPIICIHCLFINGSDYDKLVDRLDDFLRNIYSTKYAWGRFLGIVLNKPGTSNNKMVCSQFVDSVLKYIGLNLSGKDPSLTTPNDFKTEDTNIYKLYEGDLNKLDSHILKKIAEKVDVLTDSVGCDYKTAKLSSNAIKNLITQEDLSLIRAYKDLLRDDNNKTSIYLKNILPLIETYSYDLNQIPIREFVDLKYDGRDLKKLIEGE